MGALTVARMREVEAAAGLTPAPKAECAAEPAADAGAAGVAGGRAQPPQEVANYNPNFTTMILTAEQEGARALTTKLFGCHSMPLLSHRVWHVNK